MRENAEKAGFNPLTALRAGGGAGFTTTHHPSLASGGFMADALSSFGNAISSAIDPMRDATAKLEFQIKQETLKNLQADTAARKRASLGGVPVSTGARNLTARSPLQKGLPVASWLSAPKATADDLPVWVPGVDRDGKRMWIPNPDGPDIEQLAFGLAARSQAGWEAAAKTAISGDYVKSSPVNGYEKAKRGNPRKSSWSDWVPSFSINWK